MSARRNRDVHAKLIGDSSQCDRTVPSWRGHYPQGMSQQQFERAKAVRSRLWANGCRNAEIVDALERMFCPGTLTKYESPPSAILVPATTQPKLSDLLEDNWKTLKWDRKLELIQRNFPLGDIGSVDIVAADLAAKSLVLIELQLNRDESEVIDALEHYVSVMRPQLLSSGLQVEGIVLATDMSRTALTRLKSSGHVAYIAQVTTTHHVSANVNPQTAIRMKKLI